jgi:hypothetical protein
MIGGPGDWLLATALSDDGKGIVADDPISGRQVILAYGAETKTIGGITAMFDVKSNAWVALADGNATKLAGDLPDGGLTTLQSFMPASYLAVGVK